MSKVRDYKAARIEETRIDCLKKNHEDKDVEMISAYNNFLNTGDYDLSKYFEIYTEPYLEMAGLFNEKNEGSRENYRRLMSRYCIQLWRIMSGDVTNPLLKSLNSYGDRKDAQKYVEGYGKDDMIRTKAAFKHPGFFKTYKEPLKEAAWYCVHSYVTDYFLDSERMMDLIPRIPMSKKTLDCWNGYIRQMEDIPDEIQDMFILDEESHLCKFQVKMYAKANAKAKAAK